MSGREEGVGASSDRHPLRRRRVSFMEVLRRERERQRLRGCGKPSSADPPAEPGAGEADTEAAGAEGSSRALRIARGGFDPTGDDDVRRARALELIVELEEELRQIQRAIVRLEEEMAR